MSKFDPSLKCDHSWGAVSAKSDAEQTSGWRDGAGDRAKACLGRGFPRRSSLIAGQRKVGMVEDIEELRVEAEGDMLRDRNLLRQIHLGIGEMWTSVVVAP